MSNENFQTTKAMMNKEYQYFTKQEEEKKTNYQPLSHRRGSAQRESYEQ